MWNEERDLDKIDNAISYHVALLNQFLLVPRSPLLVP